MTKLFISYSRKDSTTARKLMQEFKSIDLDVWVDWEDIPPAVGWLEQIEQAIEQSDAFIFLLSPDSVVSEVCKVEVEHARKNHKRIIPIVVRDVETKEVLQSVRDLNWIFVREQDDFTVGLDKVKIAVNLDIKWVEEHRRLQVRALEWDRQKDPSLLLRGRDLRRARRMVASSSNKEPNPSHLQETYIDFSYKDERRKTFLWVSAVSAIIIMTLLSFVAVRQSQLATANEKLAQEQRLLAEENEKLALENEKLAIENAEIAEEAKILATAQRSAARAQIYQSKAGGLFTSTLLAIDSWQRTPSQEAEEILRKNISLLPVPVGSLKQNDLITAIELNPMGDTFVSTSWDGTACVSNIADAKNLYCVESAGAVQDAAFSPDGNTIVIADDTGLVLFVNSEDGEIIDRRQYKVPVWDVNISPDGASLAIARDDGFITILEFDTREVESELLTYGSLYAISFSPNGEWMAAGSDIGSVTLWNLRTGEILSGPFHKGEVFDIAFSPDSSKLISGGSDNIAILIQTSTGKEQFRIENEDWVEDVTFSPDGKWFVTASDDYRIRVWDSITGEEKLRMLQNDYLSEVKVSPNGQWIASTGWDKTARVWSAATGAEIYQVPITGFGNTITFSNDGNYLIVGDQIGSVAIWDIASLSIAKSYIQFDDFMNNVQFSPSGEWLVASSGGNAWVLTSEQIPTLTSPPALPAVSLTDNTIKHLVVSPDSKWFAFTTESGSLFLYNVSARNQKLLSATELASEIIFSADSQYLIVGDKDGLVQFWSVASGQVDEGAFDARAKVESLAVNSTQVAVAVQDKIILLDPVTRTAISEIESLGDHQLTAFSSDGRFMASNNSLGQLYIWQVVNGEFTLLQNIPKEQAYSLVFSPQGDRLFVGTSSDVYVFDSISGSEIGRIRHRDSVVGMSFSADGSLLATASFKALQFWDVQELESINEIPIDESACARLTNNFDAAQWESFFEEEPYRKLCENLPVP